MSSPFDALMNHGEKAAKKSIADRNEADPPRRPGAPRGKRSNPAYQQYSVRLEIENHDRALDELRRQGNKRPDFSEFVNDLLSEWLKGK